MTLPISSLVTVTPGVLSPGGTVSLLNGMVFSQNTVLPSGVSTFASAAEVAATCGATSVEASTASIYFSAYTNAQDTPEKLYLFQIPASPVATDYGTYLSTAADQATDWGPFLFAQEPDAAAKTQIATWLAAHPNRYWGVVQDSDATILSANAAASFGATVNAASTPGLTCVCNTDSPGTGGTLAAALCLGWAASINPNRASGRTTLMFRNNSGVPPASLTASQAQALLGNGYSFYGSYKSTDTTFSFLNNGAVSGPFSWADSYINQIWMNASFQNDLISLFSNAGQIPYNAVGDSLIATAVQGTIDTALSFGAIQPNVTLSDAQKQAVNADAGRSIDAVLSTRGWYLLPGASTASAAVRAARGTVQGRFFYMDGQSVQSIALASVEAQ
ncbi:DUF3383 family protein [Acetobacter orleanensis]|uniref:DUF3383 domain-containing protein n=1 Tax=Acetobacter orleanensis TaxID=104099 RepID=A0A4Y3TK89_9PROT|nr:DUF3383 family protein [Acetobacter orleanensis]KXV63951.1 hypothetical protein AD949_06525 [Acetobacter orleanensis]PCD79723.1 DUF3383 domain-containing protein [Acetobacter orleanensis]GAN69291.1 hypothetical protein Abol_030_056 [Acetobacter orleanensis JCM 7639]GBR28303.1 hypothetical protein AA0473_1705 [Acetobacter orleanensis NRIC 0473]GEB82183.1 hypothetical protein AOR01nite_06600 [Acetobacter orleanensis]